MASRDKAHNAEYCRLRKERRIADARAVLGGECVKCGSTENLQFDHIDQKTKLFNVTHAARSVGEAKFWAEVEKCQLLCGPHHWEKNGSERTGQINPMGSVLSSFDVEVVKALYSLGHSQAKIGKIYDVSHSCIGKIVRGQRRSIA